jgi:hypothetical protein
MKFVYSRFLRLLAIGVCSAAGHAFADGQLSPNSDILGMNFNMTPTQMKEVVGKSFAIANYQEHKDQIGTADYTAPEIVTVITFDIRPQSEVQTSGTDGTYTDHVALSLDPNSSGTSVLSIARDRTYPPENRLPVNVLVNEFTKKYGPPTYTDTMGRYVWSNAYHNDQECSYAWADVVFGRLAQGGQVNFSNFLAPILQDIDRDRQVSSPKIKAGMALRLTIWPVQGETGTYVSQFSSALTDEGRAISAFEAYDDSFQQAAQAAEKKKADQASQNKPPL